MTVYGLIENKHKVITSALMITVDSFIILIKTVRIRRKTTLVQARPVFFPPKENIKQNKKKSQLLHCETSEEKYHTLILPRV